MDSDKNQKAGGLEPKEVLVFRLGREEYAIDVDWVQEIRGYQGATRLPNSPKHVLGVSNLRGAIVPLVDLRVGLGVGEATYQESTASIILSRAGRSVGIVVDGVSDVLQLQAGQALPAPDQGGGSHAMGIVPLDERLLILLDIAGVLDALGMGEFDSSTAH
jgi:purine-binding chemotaxis protein CheW